MFCTKFYSTYPGNYILVLLVYTSTSYFKKVFSCFIFDTIIHKMQKIVQNYSR